MNVINSNAIFINNLKQDCATAVIKTPTNSNLAASNSSFSKNNGSFHLNKPDMKTLASKSSLEIRNTLQMRNLCSSDIIELKRLCAEWFPVDYPESWYNDITSNKRFFSIAAVYNQNIVGMIVAEIKSKKTTDREDWHILSNNHPENTKITYILSLGVFKELRRHGIASLLVDTLIEFLNAETDCKAIYLHVLCSNQVAINFYEKKNFQQRIYLPNYYTINGQLHDGYCYVLYMNNGQPPWTISDLVKDTWELTTNYNPCRLTFNCMIFFNNWIRRKLQNRNYFSKDFSRIS